MPGTLPDIHNLIHTYAPGFLIAGRYRLLNRIGSGGAGEVWRAVDVYGGSAPVAIKILRCDVGSNVARERFDSEVRSLALLQAHRNVVRMLDCGEADGQPFLVMEHLELSLHAWLEDYRTRLQFPPLSTVCRLFQHVCEAMATAHHLRNPGPITHRDINPQNVMLVCNCDEEWVAKLLDFGVAKVGSRSITWTGEQIGTPGYMPPEQARSEATLPCPASDVYSLGVLLTEMLTLYQPCQDRLDLEDPAGYLAGPSPEQLPVSLRRLRPDVPESIWDVIRCCLQPEVTNRYPDAAVLAQAFAQALARAPTWPLLDQIPTLTMERKAQDASCATHILCPQPETLRHAHPTLRSGEPPAFRSLLRDRMLRLWHWLGGRRRMQQPTVLMPAQNAWLPEEPTAVLRGASQSATPEIDPDGETWPRARYEPQS